MLVPYNRQGERAVADPRPPKLVLPLPRYCSARNRTGGEQQSYRRRGECPI